MTRTMLMGWLCGTLLSTVVFAAEPIQESFAGKERPQNWTVNFGHWEPEGGVLVCRQLAADNHAAASRWQVPLTDGVIRCKLKFVGATAFHIGFDPAPGQLPKQGHLYSLIVSPEGAMIKKHRDKKDEKSTESTLATAKWLTAKDWLEIELIAEGTNVTATIQGTNIRAVLKASDSTFAVAKPAVVFRCLGGDAHLDEVGVEVTKPGIAAVRRRK